MFFLNFSNSFYNLSYLYRQFSSTLKFNYRYSYLNRFSARFHYFMQTLINIFSKKSSFIAKFYKRNELIWNDGLLIDFLQKKSADLYIRKFVIYTGFLFSERFVFETVVKLYLDNLIWPFHNVSIFESSNVSEMLVFTISLFFFTFLLLYTFYFLVIIAVA